MTEQEIKDRNKKICDEWSEWHDQDEINEPVSALQKRISEKHDIHEDYIYQVLRENTATLKHNADWRKLKRLWRLQRLQATKTETKKDITDLLEQERKELEGDRPLIDNSKHIHTTYNVEGKSTAELADILNKRLRPIKV